MNIEYNSQQDGNDITINIFDMTGKKINVYQFDNIDKKFTHTIDINELTSGVYLVEIISDTETIEEMIVKE